MKSVLSSYPNIIAVNIIICVVLYFFNPIIGILTTIAIVIVNKNSNPYLHLIYILIALFLAFLNTTKIPESDQLNYIAIFDIVPDFSINDYILFSGVGVKEPIYALYSWIGYYICFGDEKIFFLLTTLIIYLLIFHSIHIVYKSMEIDNIGILAAVITIAFFTQFFTLTIHILRQMLAGSIIIFAFAEKTINKKNNWILIICAVLIHISSIFLALLYFIPNIYHRMNLKRLLYIMILGILFFSLIISISDLVGGLIGINPLSYGLERVSNQNDSDGVSISIYLIMSILFPLLLVCVVLLNRNNYNLKPIYPFIYSFIFIALFVLISFNSPLLQYRFFYYSYFYIPILLPLLFSNGNSKTIFWYGLIILMPLRFLITYNSGSFTYESLDRLLMNPIFAYL